MNINWHFEYYVKKIILKVKLNFKIIKRNLHLFSRGTRIGNGTGGTERIQTAVTAL